MKELIMALGIAGLTLGIAVAQERRGSEKMEMKDTCGEVVLDKPYHDVARRLPESISRAGLILAGEIDWAALARRAPAPRGSMPSEEPRLDAEGKQVKTYLIVDEHLIEKVLEQPHHGFHMAKAVLFEEAGKAKVMYLKPSKILEEKRKHGLITEEEYEEHIKMAKECEKRLEAAINDLKTEK